MQSVQMKNGTLYADGIAIECDGMVGSIASSPDCAADTREAEAAQPGALAARTFIAYVCTDGELVKRDRADCEFSLD
jgi:hypothetical protein